MNDYILKRNEKDRAMIEMWIDDSKDPVLVTVFHEDCRVGELNDLDEDWEEVGIRILVNNVFD